MEAIVQRSAGLDVHRKSVVATVLIEQDDGSIFEQTREFGTFKKHRRELCDWLTGHRIELAIMESTSVYWKSIFCALEGAGITAHVVNARHVKHVPGRKTDVQDSQWLASLARYGLLRPSFIPPEDLRELRLLSRRRIKLQGMLAGEKNRLHKVLDDAGIRLGNVVSDISGISAQAIINGLIDGKKPSELMQFVRGRLKKKIPELLDALDDSLSERHLFALRYIRDHICFLEKQRQEIDQYILAAMSPYKSQWEILQTIPGVDQISAAMMIIEIGVDMKRFGSMERLASWAGMCPGNNESAGKRKSGRTRKGNRTVRQLLCEISNAARRTNSQFKSKYKGLVGRRGHKRSIIAIGHKILRIMFVLLKKLVPYRDPDVDYEALLVKRNAPRWIRALKKFGYLQESNLRPAAC